MGMDVYGIFQRREQGQWELIDRFIDSQRGALRPWLGLSELSPFPTRGLPVDFISCHKQKRPRKSRTPELERIEYVYVGTEWQSWATADEVLNASTEMIDYGSEEITDFKQLVLSLGQQHGEIRFVWGFS